MGGAKLLKAREIQRKAGIRLLPGAHPRFGAPDQCSLKEDLVMKAWLNRCARQMFAALELIARRRLQPVPVPSDERRRLAEWRRQRQ